MNGISGSKIRALTNFTLTKETYEAARLEPTSLEEQEGEGVMRFSIACQQQIER